MTKKEKLPKKEARQGARRHSGKVFWALGALALVIFLALAWQNVWLRAVGLGGESFSLEEQEGKLLILEKRIAQAQSFMNDIALIPGEDWRRLEQMLPANPELPALLLELNLRAQEEGWNISLLGFSTSKSDDSERFSTLDAKSLDDMSSQVQKFSIRMNVHGSVEYTRFKDLLSSMEESLRLVAIKNFSYQSEKESFSLTLEGYWFPSELEDREASSAIVALLEGPPVGDLFSDKRFLSLSKLSRDEYAYHAKEVYVAGSSPASKFDLVAYDPGYGKTILLSWSAAPEDVERIHVFRSSNPVSLGEEVVSLPASMLYYADKDISNSKPYYYSLRGSNSDGEMGNRSLVVSASASDRIPPGPVSHVSFESSSDGTLTISWQNPADSDFSHVNVYRSRNSQEEPQKTGSAVEGGLFTDRVSSGAGHYNYFLSTVDTSGNESEIFSLEQLLSSGVAPFK